MAVGRAWVSPRVPRDTGLAQRTRGTSDEGGTGAQSMTLPPPLAAECAGRRPASEKAEQGPGLLRARP